jgi:hypothetical protein
MQQPLRRSYVTTSSAMPRPHRGTSSSTPLCDVRPAQALAKKGRKTQLLQEGKLHVIAPKMQALLPPLAHVIPLTFTMDEGGQLVGQLLSVLSGSGLTPAAGVRGSHQHWCTQRIALATPWKCV